MNKILLIGGNGYIGNRIYTDLSSDYDITSIDTCWFNDPLVPTTKVDYNDLSESFYSDFDIIILLAGHSSVKMCEGYIHSAYNNNIRNFVNLLSKLKPNQKFIYASSSSVYGDVGEKIVNEEYNNFIPYNHYDITKHIIDLYSPKFNVQYYGLRFGTVNGYSPVVRNDIMLNSMTYNALKDKEIKLYIKDIIRPILGISDLVKAVKCIVDNDNDNRGIYNLASFNNTAEQLANSVSKITKMQVKEYQVDPNNIQNSKLQTKCYNFSIDCSKFMSTFNFEFKETPESIVTELIENFNKIIFNSRNKFKNYE
jgi:nucleoside-diphosphate-sugar epimerase